MFLVYLFELYLLVAWMQELKILFCEMFLFFFFVYGFEYKRTVSQNWLADVTGQLKTTCITLWECSCCLLEFTKVRPVLKKSFIMLCLYLFYLAHLPFYFSNNSHQTLELFLFLLFLWLSMTSLTSLQFFYLFICAPHQSSHYTVFFFFTLCSRLMVRRYHHFDCVPALVR